MREIGAKTVQGLRAKQLFQQRAKPRFFVRLVAVASEEFAALDRVGDVLGHVAHFGEGGPVAPAGNVRVDEPGRDQAEEVEAPLFVVCRLMDGPLSSNRRLSLSERSVTLGELSLERGVLSPQSFRVSLEAQRLFLPAKRFTMELFRFSKIVVRI